MKKYNNFSFEQGKSITNYLYSFDFEFMKFKWYLRFSRLYNMKYKKHIPYFILKKKYGGPTFFLFKITLFGLYACYCDFRF